MPTLQFFSYIIVRKSPLCTRPTRLVEFLQCQLPETTLRGQTCPSLGHIILILSQSLLFLLNVVCLAEKQEIPILQSYKVWHDLGSNPESTAPEASMLIITPLSGNKYLRFSLLTPSIMSTIFREKQKARKTMIIIIIYIGTMKSQLLLKTYILIIFFRIQLF